VDWEKEKSFCFIFYWGFPCCVTGSENLRVFMEVRVIYDNIALLIRANLEVPFESQGDQAFFI